mmetsp:Transcript_21175/g.31177  ORF Transcript_21175/g.31177 Transcript_21175/m.31177 type:complete len:632 (+) Transcript_21175:82-1977(+)
MTAQQSFPSSPSEEHLNDYCSSDGDDQDELSDLDICFGSAIKGNDHFDWLDRKKENVWQMVDVLRYRLDALNKFIETNELATKLVIEDCDVTDSSPTNSLVLEQGEKSIFGEEDDTKQQIEENFVSNSGQCSLRCPHSLAFRNPDLPQTDAGRKLESLFLNYREDSVEGIHGRSGGGKSKKRGISRIEAKRREKKKRTIQAIQGELEANASRHLARAANSLRYRITKSKDQQGRQLVDEVNGKGIKHAVPDKCNPHTEEWPIPLGNDMKPELLIRLSCEKIVLPSGESMLKRLALHSVSLNLYVYMFWFVHCRFFQPHSGKEQGYLLGKVAAVFPHFIASISSLEAPPQKRDFLFRHYPLLLSKAIYLGFKYLCPGNHGLFRGAFQRVLYLSVFRLLTGVDICPGSVDALRWKVYPEDAADEQNSENQDNDANRKRSMRSSRMAAAARTVITSHSRARRRSVPAPIVALVKPTKAANESNLLPRQQQVNFDACAVSPLLQQCLKSVGGEWTGGSPSSPHQQSNGRRQILKRTEPVRYCRTGGVETHRSRLDEMDVEDKRRVIMMDSHAAARARIREEYLESDATFRKKMRELERERLAMSRGGKERVGEYAANVLRSLHGVPGVVHFERET